MKKSPPNKGLTKLTSKVISKFLLMRQRSTCVDILSFDFADLFSLGQDLKNLSPIQFSQWILTNKGSIKAKCNYLKPLNQDLVILSWNSK